MAHAVFIQNPKSIYADEPGLRYHFPKRYLGTVISCVGDWVVFYESRANGGAFGYTAVQRVLSVDEDPNLPDHFYATLEPNSLLDFETTVPRQAKDGMAFENSLRKADGSPMSGGANVSAVRRISPVEFAAIVSHGLTELDGADALPRVAVENQVSPFVHEAHANFKPAPLAGFRRDILTNRKYRDQSFARSVKNAYGARCAISGLELRNGGGRPEVEAAHIRPVSDGGPDIVRNGLALSGTVHWMFDRGLISIAEDHTILVSHNKVPGETARRLINPEGKLFLPREPRHHPHPDFLRYHREEVFGRSI